MLFNEEVNLINDESLNELASWEKTNILEIISPYSIEEEFANKLDLNKEHK